MTTTHAYKLAREDVITEALRAADEAIGDEKPTKQAMRIIAAIKGLRSAGAVRVPGTARIDYLEQVQRAAQSAWTSQYTAQDIGVEHEAIAGIDTPIGRLKAITWRRRWSTGRIAWATEYYLDDNPVTIAEIRQAGLAQRPTSRAGRRGRP